MAVKIKVSYERQQEIKNVLKLLEAEVRSCKVSKTKAGKYYKAYIILKE